MTTLGSQKRRKLRKRFLTSNPSNIFNCHYCNIEIKFRQDIPIELWEIHKDDIRKEMDKDLNSLSFDHFIPSCYGGTSRYENIRLCCLQCNRIRGIIGDHSISIRNRVEVAEKYLQSKGKLNPDFYKYLFKSP